MPDVDSVEEYFLIRSQLESLRQIMHKVIVEPLHILPFMQPGRLIKVRPHLSSISGRPFTLELQVNGHWGIVINFQKKPTTNQAADGDKSQPSQMYIVDALLPLAAQQPKEQQGTDPGPMEVTPVMLHVLEEVCSLVVRFTRLC